MTRLVHKISDGSSNKGGITCGGVRFLILFHDEVPKSITFNERVSATTRYLLASLVASYKRQFRSFVK